MHAGCLPLCSVSRGVVGGLVSGLNQLLCRVQGFDGTWVGQADGEALASHRIGKPHGP